MPEASRKRNGCGTITHAEEQRRLLRTAPKSAMAETPHIIAPKRALKAALTLDEKTDGLRLTFKSHAESKLDLIVEKGCVFINDKWASFESSQEISPCWISKKTVNKAHVNHKFEDHLCDHIATDLSNLILKEVSDEDYGEE
ncbi:hypothetical protein IFR05_002974 [Cadophora sp. M221]|nr:hypothetical protein IFR05_002974 [Cadophora sp. M221]